MERQITVVTVGCGSARVAIALVGIVIMGVLFSGCSMRKLMIGEMAKVMEDGFPTYIRETDPILVRDAMAPNLKLIEALLENDPENERLLLLACQGFASHAFMFVETEDPQRARLLYMRARKYGYALLEQRGLIPDAVYELSAWDKALARARKKDVPAIFWTAFAWGGQIQLDRESPVALADLPIVIRLVEQAATLDRQYWFAGPDTFLGFYNGSVPVPLGGRADKSRAHFEDALEITERRSLMVQVLYARSYCVQVQDRKLYNALVREVMDADLAKCPPDTALSNAVAQRKAGELERAADDLFAGE